MISAGPSTAHNNRLNYNSCHSSSNNPLYLVNAKNLNLHLLLNILISLVISTSEFL